MHPPSGLALPARHFVHLLRYISRGAFLGFDGRSVQQAAAAAAAADCDCSCGAHRCPASLARPLFPSHASDVRTPAVTPVMPGIFAFTTGNASVIEKIGLIVD